MTPSLRLAVRISGAIALGVVVGEVCHLECPTPERARDLAEYFSLASDTFLRLIKMVVAPLVFSTLASGMAAIGVGPSVARIAARTLLCFVVGGLASLAIGLCVANVLCPGAEVGLPILQSEVTGFANSGELTLRAFVTRAVPVSVFEALATNSILQIVVFAAFVGMGISAVGQRAAPLLRGLDAVTVVMLKITDRIVRAAPLAAFAALAAIVTTRGAAVLVIFGKLLGCFYFALLLLWMAICTAAYLVLGRRALTLLRSIRDPVLLAFATASSEAALAPTLEQLNRIGLPQRIVGFVIPMGLSFNTCGSMLYCAFAISFLAQAYGIPQTIPQQLAAMLVLMMASKGLAGVPRASLVVVSAVLPQLGIPTAGMAMLVGVDQLLDMGRTATNVAGNAVTTALIARWEGSRICAATGSPPDRGSG